ncbi:MAG: pyridoxamine 5'-phosphate oxidase family protein, partial [Verrucomicrobiales bacterium]|nr:pyridoxamine 5'-phosphate oxidase family protein [Verrucomicrobiales bacterium]
MPETKTIDTDKLPDIAKECMKLAKFPQLATIENDRPRVRPVSPVKTDQFTVYVANLKNYDKTAQIKANPSVELCYMSPDHDQVRIAGTAEILINENEIHEIWESNALLRKYLGSPDNPQLIIYK